MKKVGIILSIMLLLFVTCMGTVLAEENIESESEESLESGTYNMLLIGVDRRDDSWYGNSDVMILVTVNSQKETIYMTSFLRDLYADIPGISDHRLNAACANGGAELCVQTIKDNYGVQIDNYAMVDFNSMAEIVDNIGGVEVEISDAEMEFINKHIAEQYKLAGRSDVEYLEHSGTVLMNGYQTVVYTRDRTTGISSDFGRTERQRKVLSAVMKKLPLAMATNSGELIDGLFPNLTTNLTQTEMYSLSTQASKLLTYDVVQSTVPAEGTYSNATIRKMAVLQVDFEANKKLLKQEIYGQEE